ncbi:MAG: transcriptional regulator, GntR family [Conexibacter sp.]|nr:transcriptional regulator, GntR family [Conexibacter sp.]
MPTQRIRVVSRDGQNVANVVTRLREAILNGDIPGGAVTTQLALATEFETGRTPVREALRLLEREGLVVADPNRRVRVTDLSAADAEELYVMRVALETVAIRLTIPTLSSDDIAELEACMAKMEHYMRAKDQIGMREPHRSFHVKLVAAAGPRGVAEIEQLFDHAERYRLAHGALTRRDWTLRSDEHRAILDAVIAGDAARAARELAEHYAHTARLVFSNLDAAFDGVRLRAALAAVAPGSESALG